MEGVATANLDLRPRWGPAAQEWAEPVRWISHEFACISTETYEEVVASVGDDEVDKNVVPRLVEGVESSSCPSAAVVLPDYRVEAWADVDLQRRESSTNR